MANHAEVNYVLQECVSLSAVSDSLWPHGHSLPGSSVHGILQVRILKWVATPFSRGSSWPKDRTQVFHIAGRFFTVWATREALRILEWVVIPFFKESSWSRDLTQVTCTAGRFFTIWTSREATGIPRPNPNLKQEHQFRKLRAEVKLCSSAVSTQLRILRKGLWQQQREWNLWNNTHKTVDRSQMITILNMVWLSILIEHCFLCRKQIGRENPMYISMKIYIPVFAHMRDNSNLD